MIIRCLQNPDFFSDIEKDVVNFMIQHPNDVIKTNIRDLAKATYTSPSTIMRICKKVGADGFTDFKIRLLLEINGDPSFSQELDVNIPFEEGELPEEIAKKICQISKNSIDETYEKFDFDNLNDIVNLIVRSNRIDLYGEGDSLLAAAEFKSKLLRLGYSIHVEKDHTQQTYQALCSSSKDCAIMVSYSGTNPRILQIAHILRDRQVPRIIVTSQGDSPLRQMGNYTIEIGSSEKKRMISKVTTFGSQTAMHYIFNTLFFLIYSRNFSENLEVTTTNEHDLATKYIIKSSK